MIRLYEITVWNKATSAEEQWFFCTGSGYSTSPAVHPPHGRTYLPLVKQAMSLGLSLWSGGIGGASRIEVGPLTLVNSPRIRSEATGHYLDTGYTFDGRAIRELQLSGPDAAYSSAVVTFVGVMDPATRAARTLELRAADKGLLFDQPVQQARYAGTGGAEGGADLTDKVKPECLGYCAGVEGVYLGVDGGGLHTFQFRNGAITDVPRGYSGGKALTKVTGTPTAGQYRVNAAAGTVSLGGSLSQAPYTWDVDGHPLYTVASQLQYLARLVLSAGEVDSASISAGAALFPAVTGHYWRDEVSIRDAMDQRAADGEFFWAFDGLGRLIIGRYDKPGIGAVAVRDFTSADIVRGSFAVDAAYTDNRGIPPSEVVLGYARCWRPLAATDIVTNAEAANRSFHLEAFRTARAVNAGIPTMHKGAKPLRRDTNIRDRADALTEAARRCRGALEIARFRATGTAARRGDIVRVTSSFPGYEAGLLGVVIGVELPANPRTISIGYTVVV